MKTIRKTKKKSHNTNTNCKDLFYGIKVGGDGNDDEEIKKGEKLSKLIATKLQALYNIVSKGLTPYYNTIKKCIKSFQEISALLLKSLFFALYDELIPDRKSYTEKQIHIIRIFKYFYVRACSAPYIRFGQLFKLFKIMQEHLKETGWKKQINDYHSLEDENPIYKINENDKINKAIQYYNHIKKLYNPMNFDIVQDILEEISESLNDSFKKTKEELVNKLKEAFNYLIEIGFRIREYISRTNISLPKILKGGARNGKTTKRFGSRPLKHIRTKKGGNIKGKLLSASNYVKKSISKVGSYIMDKRQRQQRFLQQILNNYVALDCDFIKERKHSFLINGIIDLLRTPAGNNIVKFNGFKIDLINAHFAKLPYYKVIQPKLELLEQYYILLKNLSQGNTSINKFTNTLIKEEEIEEQNQKKSIEYLKQEPILLDSGDITIDDYKYQSGDIDKVINFTKIIITKIRKSIENDILFYIKDLKNEQQIKIKEDFKIQVQDIDNELLWKKATVGKVTITDKKKNYFHFDVRYEDDTTENLVFDNTGDNIKKNSDRIREDTVRFDKSIVQQKGGKGSIKTFLTSSVVVQKSENYDETYTIINLVNESTIDNFKQGVIKETSKIIDSFRKERKHIIHLKDINKLTTEYQDLDIYNRIIKDNLDELLFAGDILQTKYLYKNILDDIIHKENGLYKLKENLIANIDKHYDKLIATDKKYNENRATQNSEENSKSFESQTLHIKQILIEMVENDKIFNRKMLIEIVMGKNNNIHNLFYSTFDIDEKLQKVKLKELTEYKNRLLKDLDLREKLQKSLADQYSDRGSTSPTLENVKNVKKIESQLDLVKNNENKLKLLEDNKTAVKELYKFLTEIININIKEDENKKQDDRNYGNAVVKRIMNEVIGRKKFEIFLKQDLKNKIKNVIENSSIDEINQIIQEDNINKKNKILFEHLLDIQNIIENAKPYQGTIQHFISKKIYSLLKNSFHQEFKNTFKELLISCSNQEFASVLSSIAQITFVAPATNICITLQNNPFIGRFSPGCIISAYACFDFLFKITLPVFANDYPNIPIDKFSNAIRDTTEDITDSAEIIAKDSVVNDINEGIEYVDGANDIKYVGVDNANEDIDVVVVNK